MRVEIEAIAARILDAIAGIQIALPRAQAWAIDRVLWTIAGAIKIGVLRRIPEHMDPAIYYRTFPPYI